MEFSKEDILAQCQHVEVFFDFSDDCSLNLEEYLLDHDLVEMIDDIPMLTYVGYNAIGYTKEELQNMYGDDYDEC